MSNRRASPSKANLLAQAMNSRRKNRPTDISSNLITMDDLTNIKTSIASSQQPQQPNNATDLVI